MPTMLGNCCEPLALLSLSGRPARACVVLNASGALAGLGNGDVLITLTATADPTTTCTDKGGTHLAELNTPLRDAAAGTVASFKRAVSTAARTGGGGRQSAAYYGTATWMVFDARSPSA